MAAIHWIIDTDHTEEPGSEYSAAGRSHGDPALCTIPVRLYDDDNTLYFSGRIAPETLDADESVSFALLNWAERSAGCTRMDWLTASQTWVTL